MSFAFLENASYMVSDETREDGRTFTEAAVKRAEDYFADL